MLWPYIVLFVILVVVFVIVQIQAEKKETQNIKSAEIVRRTQIMKEKLRESGFSVGWSGDSRTHYEWRDVPSHVEVLFNVTYFDGSVRKVKAVEGSKKYDTLMNYVKQVRANEKSDIPKQNAVKKNDIQAAEIKSKSTQKDETKQTSAQNKSEYAKQDKPPEIKKNQLTAGYYEIGKDIPAGRFDFEWVWGHGVITKYKCRKSDDHYDYDDRNYDEAIGEASAFYKQYLVSVVCLDGEFLRITGNVIVDIKRSKDIELDL